MLRRIKAARPNYDLDERIPMEKRNKQIFWVGSGVAGLILVATGVVFWGRWNLQVTEADVVVEPTGEPELVLVEEPELARGEMSLEVLNGSGVAGAAARVAGQFEELGYRILEIGNVETTEGNQVYVRASDKDRAARLLEDAKEKLGVGEVTGELKNSTATARIVIGK